MKVFENIKIYYTRKSTRKFILKFLTAFALFYSSSSYAAVYEASSLHNAVSRSQTVQDLFFERWAIIQEQELYVDFFGKINWVPGFNVNTVNHSTGEKSGIDMRLIRTYGSLTINYPVFGGYSGKSLKERAFRGIDYKKKKSEKTKGSGPLGLIKPKNLIIGFTMTGFHYGLTSATTIERGEARSQTVTDYQFSQFFDDIFALSLLYRPYFYIHAGVLINNQIEPNDDGTIDYGNSSNRTIRYFVSSNLLSFLNLNATTTNSELEAFAMGFLINELLEVFSKSLSKVVPKLTISYKMLNFFQDQAYDTVWVDSIYTTDSHLERKSPVMSDDLKDEATIHNISVLMKKNFKNKIFIKTFFEFQLVREDLYEKRNEHEVYMNPLKEFNLEVGYNFLKTTGNKRLVATMGVSKYWDLAIPVHREIGTGFSLWGGSFSLKFEMPRSGFQLRISHNDSTEVKKLVETADKWIIDASTFARF